MNAPTQFNAENKAPCPKCGTMNERGWALCDNCAERLPWAPPPLAPRKVSDMTPEELEARFANLPKREPSFLTSRRNIYLIIFGVSLLIDMLWELLKR